MIAGNGDRVLTMAARHADIIGLTGSDVGKGVEDPLAERLAFVRQAAGDRFDDPGTQPRDHRVPRRRFRHARSVDDPPLRPRPRPTRSYWRYPRRWPVRRAMSPTNSRQLRDTYGMTSFSLQHHHAEYFSKVIAELR